LDVQFKSFSDRVDDIDINVYRSLHQVKAEPSEGSSFFRDCLVEWRVRMPYLCFLFYGCRSRPFKRNYLWKWLTWM